MIIADEPKTGAAADDARGVQSGKMVTLQLPSLADLVNLMNLEGHWNVNIQRLYGSVSPTALQGVIDRVRTALIVLVAEMSTTMPEGAEIPSAEVATNAFTVAVEGKRNQVTVSAPRPEAQ